MPLRRTLFLMLIAPFLWTQESYAQNSNFTDEQIKAAREAQRTQEEEEQDKENAPWHFLLSVKDSQRGVGHAGTTAVIEGTMQTVYKNPPSQESVKSKRLHFSFYCGISMSDAPVDPCKPYLASSTLEIWGKFVIGSDGEPVPDSLIVTAVEPQ